MKIKIIAVGKAKSAEQILADKYLTRITKFNTTIIEINEKNIDQNITKQEEKIMTLCKSSCPIIILDNMGKEFTSTEFANFLKKLESNHNLIHFIIGGASGLSTDFKQKSFFNISLGKMTYPHQLARILLLEQIYRSQTILTSHPYHK